LKAKQKAERLVLLKEVNQMINIRQKRWDVDNAIKRGIITPLASQKPQEGLHMVKLPLTPPEGTQTSTNPSCN